MTFNRLKKAILVRNNKTVSFGQESGLQPATLYPESITRNGSS